MSSDLKSVALIINGIAREVKVDPDMLLIDLLRCDLRLTGTKQSCDRKGQCGACAVIINGKSIHSCLKKVVDLDGAEVITIEGLGTPENPHLIQEAFVLAGAIQCGFCTPAMIIAARALLDQNPNPSIPDIKKALTRNLCRCTGYKKIIDAVQLAGRFIRGETNPENIRRQIGDTILGAPLPRPTAMLKACGLARFGDDIQLPENTVELAIVRSTQFHALIKSVDTSAAAKKPGVVGFMTAEDIKGTNRIRITVPDQPVLCEDKVRTLGDPIIVVAALTRDQARAAAAAVKVEYELLPVMLNPAEALVPEAYQIHRHAAGNVFASQALIKGDVDKALAESKAVIEAEFSTQRNHMSPLEPEVSLAYFDAQGENAPLVVIGRSINIHVHLAQIKEAVGYDNIGYQEAFSGGQFGIKLLVTTEAVTAAAALHFKRPVRYVSSMEESMLITSKRHPANMQVKLAADADGLLTAYWNNITANKGAYTVTGPAYMRRTICQLHGSYYIPNIKAFLRSVYTNNSYSGSARGAGAPQVAFALECSMDMLAEKMGIDPLEFRRLNSLRLGQTKCTGMAVKEWPFAELCDAVKPYYDKVKQKVDAFNARSENPKRGVGIAGFAYGIGNPSDVAEMAIEIDPDDGITIYGAVADPGEGNDSMLTQIAAYELGLPVDKVRLYTRDTSKTVGVGSASGSRMTLMAGNSLLNAIAQLKNAMQSTGVHTYTGMKKAGLPTRYQGSTKTAGSPILDPKTGQGDSYVTECHNLQMVEVEVNTDTGVVRVLKITSAVDAGTIINRQASEGQVDGGIDQGVGYALREEFLPGKTKDFVTFKFPTILDNFDSEIITLETSRPPGPLGATGIGEMTMTSTAPAVINAIKNACGVRIFDLPATPEKVKTALAMLKKE